MKATDKVFIRIDAVKDPPKARGVYNTNRGLCRYSPVPGTWSLIDGASPNLSTTNTYVLPAWWMLELTIQDILDRLKISI